MKHLYQNADGEIVAADTAAQARAYYDGLSGTEGPDDWTQMGDGALAIGPADGDDDPPETKTVQEWAAECPAPTQVATTYG